MTSLLPDNATVFEKTVEQAVFIPGSVATGISAAEGLKYKRPLSGPYQDFGLYLVQEYGLGPISDYFDSVESLIDQGRAWQKKRGTPSALRQALSWIGYDNLTLEDQARFRRRWHLFQLGMGELPMPATEIAQLLNAEKLSVLSSPARSELFRGYFGYDVRAFAWGRTRFGNGIFGDSSGARVPGGSVKWSHGREHVLNVTASDANRTALGVDYSNGQVLTWADTITWDAPGMTWNGIVNAGALKSWLMLRKRPYLSFYTAAGVAIGHAAVLTDPLDMTAAGAASTAPRVIRYEVRTRFGTGTGKTCGKIALSFGGKAKAGLKPFEPWLEPDQIEFPDGEIRVGESHYTIAFMTSVREHIILNLTL
jgi:hypothetical protein